MSTSPPPYTHTAQQPLERSRSWLQRVRVRIPRPAASASGSEGRAQHPGRRLAYGAPDCGQSHVHHSRPVPPEPPDYTRDLPAPVSVPVSVAGDTSAPPDAAAASVPPVASGLTAPSLDSAEEAPPSYASDPYTFSHAKVLVVATKGAFDPYLTVTDAETGKALLIPDVRMSTTSAQRRADLFSHAPAQPSAVQYHLRDPSTGQAVLTLLTAGAGESLAIRPSGQAIFTLTGSLAHAAASSAEVGAVAIIRFAPECNLGTLHIHRGLRGWSIHPPEHRAHAWAYIDHVPTLRRKLRVHVAPDVSTLYMAAVAVCLCSP